ncbi:hypothetical protein CHS0354_031093 [Potamilus streckersoni]|uniref:Histidine-specific methyltransferase SAM-dependent domain-containing protein n=1 Tax=Potamilus streckersoni TaxID=2493646 RepID=A0AAE0S037_9BIVA|nr:hypothetical protein CHS0354_031093 [Potamilus streckersoni]
MDIADAVRQGLTSSPRYLPVWFRYDNIGSILNDKCLTDNKYYYFHKSELDIIQRYINEMVCHLKFPCSLVDLGSGNSIKTRRFIDVLLKYQDKLKYIPVDISRDFLFETSNALSEIYANCLMVQPVAGDYSVGIEEIGKLADNKLICWFGGGNQNESRTQQVSRLLNLSRNISADDRLLIAYDITQNEEEILNAYLNPTGVCANLYLNALHRLNRDFQGNFNIDNFKLDASFSRDLSVKGSSAVVMRVRSTCKHEVYIPGLNLTLPLEEGEYINLFEGEGVSHKYTLDQIRGLAEDGQLHIEKIWTDAGNHVAYVMFSNRTNAKQAAK